MSGTTFFILGIFGWLFLLIGLWMYVYVRSARTQGQYLYILYRKVNQGAWTSELTGKVLKRTFNYSDIDSFQVDFLTLAGTKNKAIKVILNDGHFYFTTFGNVPLPFVKNVDEKVDELNLWLHDQRNNNIK